ncbi:hypothetical protein L1887_07432 [Cichorium endivia]|nr:hypothetical protein L1887_07432 [Cichorium endivia]
MLIEVKSPTSSMTRDGVVSVDVAEDEGTKTLFDDKEILQIPKTHHRPFRSLSSLLGCFPFLFGERMLTNELTLRTDRELWGTPL